MPRSSVDVSPANRSVSFPNGTRLETIAAFGSATQFIPPAAGLRSAERPSEIDTSPLFDKALAEAGIYEQETIQLEVQPEAPLRSGSAEDAFVLRPAIPAGDPNPRVVLYEDDSGGLSWHFAEGSRLTAEERDRLERRGLLRDTGTPTFRIPARSTASRSTLVSGPPKGALRGFVTKIGRKVLKVLVIPLASKVLERPVDLLVGAIEKRVSQNRIWQLTPDNYATGPKSDFTDWKSLNGKPTLLVVHGIFSSVEGMLNKLPRTAMEQWVNHYEGRAIAFNHLSVTLSPEENARFFLETAKRAVPEGNFQFDIVCHSRGGIVSRTMAERGRGVFADTNSTFRKVYFAAAPNKGSALGDPAHMLEMIDVFTNGLTQFPDGHVLYAIETILGVVKLMAYTAGVALPGMASMSPSPDGYIAKVLNQASVKSPAKYAAAGSDYVPRTGADNGFFTGPFVTYVMDKIFVDHGRAVANDLVVPKDGVFAGNGHLSFPILNPLVYKGDDAVWHGGFFAEPKTIRHIESFLEIENGAGFELDVVQPLTKGAQEILRSAGNGNQLRGGAIAAPLPATSVEREPAIDFHEVVNEGVSNDLVVKLCEVAEFADIENLLAVEFAAGEEQIELTVELSAPGFRIDNRTATMQIKRTRDPETERAAFVLTAKSPGPQPVTRTIIASFFRGGDCLGGVTHLTEVIPAGYGGPIVPHGGGKSDRVVISSQQRMESDLIIFVREDKAQPDTFEIAIKCNIPGEEYAMRDKGVLKLQGSEFSDFFSKVIDPEFQKFPTDPNLNEADFDAAFATWSDQFLMTLDRLGRRLWTLLPQEFRDEYIRLLTSSTPPRSLCIYSDEMVLPWELVRPSAMVAGQFQEYPRLGVLHVVARWKPELGAKPQPQALRVQKMMLLTPSYQGKPLYWAQKESAELLKLIQDIDQPLPVDLRTVEDLLDGSGVQIVHFNGHGVWDPTGDLTSLQLSDTEAIPALAFTGRKLGMTAHPILYLNACSVGRGAMTVGRPGGFAVNCLEGGWSGVIAPYWNVYDPQAMDFSVKLYRKLKSGISIGEALQQIRSDEPKNFTAQSFAYFGDPHARLLLP